MIERGEAARLRQEDAHAPFRPGMRVRLKENFPYGYHGALGTIMRLPHQLNAPYVHVLFDGRDRENKYAKVYLEPVASGDT